MMSILCHTAQVIVSLGVPSSSSKEQQQRKEEVEHVYIRTNNEDAETDWASSLKNGELLNGLNYAYDVLRCDLCHDFKSDGVKCFHLWGLEFHLSRLRASFLCLIHSNRRGEGGDSMIRTIKAAGQDHDLQILLDEALLRSKEIVFDLISQLCASCQRNSFFLTRISTKNVIQARLTLFWIPTACQVESERKIIDVRAHIYTDENMRMLDPTLRPSHIQATLACLPPPLALETGGDCERKKNDESFFNHNSIVPTRENAQNAKLSSWIKERKKLEPFRLFKTSEILLLGKVPNEKSSPTTIKKAEGSNSKDTEHTHRYHSTPEYLQNFEILEGATSNFFAIYHDNTIRTANDGIVYGYVRHLVLQFASKCGLKVELTPCRIEDGMKGLWKEVFITSSSRLIYPIDKIFVLDYSQKENSDESNLNEDDKNITTEVEDKQHLFVEGTKAAPSSVENSERYSWCK